jgi:hypothetical protein
MGRTVHKYFPTSGSNTHTYRPLGLGLQWMVSFVSSDTSTVHRLLWSKPRTNTET